MSTTCLDSLALTLVLVLALPACKGEAPAAAEAESAGRAQAVEAPAPIPAEQPALPPQSETAPKPDDAVVAPPPKPPEPALPLPEFVELALVPDADPVQVLLGGDQPETIEVLATFEHGKKRVVLYRVDHGARWYASRADDDPLVETITDALDKCESADSYAYNLCLEEAPALPGVPTELVLHLAHADAYAWEIAEVEFDRAGKARILARVQLLDFGIPTESEGEGEGEDELAQTKLKVYDMDGDKRSEVLVVFAFDLPGDMLEHSGAALGFVLDRADYHVQFATTRSYVNEMSDVSSHSKTIQTTWLARDENGDGYNDLVVSERSRVQDEPGDYDDEPASDTRAKRSSTCLYELAGDRWVCPEWLGTEILDGSKRVELTRVPVPVEPVPPAPLAESTPH